MLQTRKGRVCLAVVFWMPFEPFHSNQWQHNRESSCLYIYIKTYSYVLHGVLNIFPHLPGMVTHQVCHMETFTQGHKLSVLVSVSGVRRTQLGVRTSSFQRIKTRGINDNSLPVQDFNISHRARPEAYWCLNILYQGYITCYTVFKSSSPWPVPVHRLKLSTRSYLGVKQLASS